MAVIMPIVLLLTVYLGSYRILQHRAGYQM